MSSLLLSIKSGPFSLKKIFQYVHMLASIGSASIIYLDFFPVLDRSESVLVFVTSRTGEVYLSDPLFYVLA